jgi:hypothetical protein
VLVACTYLHLLTFAGCLLKKPEIHKLGSPRPSTEYSAYPSGLWHTHLVRFISCRHAMARYPQIAPLCSGWFAIVRWVDVPQCPGRGGPESTGPPSLPSRSRSNMAPLNAPFVTWKPAVECSNSCLSQYELRVRLLGSKASAIQYKSVSCRNSSRRLLRCSGPERPGSPRPPGGTRTRRCAVQGSAL